MEQSAFGFLPALRVSKIISGGQTGVDRAALDAAIQLGMPHGGFCPRGRRAEDGPIHARYWLRETKSEHYHVRTEMNVAAADATLILYRKELRGGTKLTYEYALQQRKPCLRVNLIRQPNIASARRWLAEREVVTLNIAGPRESQAEGIHAAARDWLLRLFAGYELAD